MKLKDVPSETPMMKLKDDLWRQQYDEVEGRSSGGSNMMKLKDVPLEAAI